MSIGFYAQACRKSAKYLMSSSQTNFPSVGFPATWNTFLPSINQNLLFCSSTKVPEVKKRVGKKKRLIEPTSTRRKGYYGVVAYSTAQEYDLEDLSIKLENHDLLLKSGLSKELKNADFLHAILQQEGKQNETEEVFIFREGAFVTWNVSEIDVEVVLNLLKKYQTGAISDDIIRLESEVMSYTYGDNCATNIVDEDIILEEEAYLDKYAVSNAMALSVKLGTWEEQLSRYIDSMETVTEDLKKGSKIRMSQADVMRKTGELFMLRHAINLRCDLLDTPDTYWDREKLEAIFQMTSNYFSISKRTKVINEKLNHCIELVELLSSHLRDNHHVRLEWMIIILIMVEVAFEILHHVESRKPFAENSQN